MAVGEGGEGSFAALKRLLGTAVAIGKTRFELLSVELQEEKLRLLGMLVYAGAALFFLGVGIILLVFFLAVAFWEQRLVVFGLATLLFLVVGSVCAARAAGAARRGSPVFAQSLAELESDLARLKRSVSESR